MKALILNFYVVARKCPLRKPARSCGCHVSLKSSFYAGGIVVTG